MFPTVMNLMGIDPSLLKWDTEKMMERRLTMALLLGMEWCLSCFAQESGNSEQARVLVSGVKQLRVPPSASLVEDSSEYSPF